MYSSPLTYDWSVAMIFYAFATPIVIPPLIFIEKFVIPLTLIQSILAMCESVFCFVMCSFIMF